MPTYEYQCTECGERVEVFQKISDDPLTDCAVCGGPLRKLFHPVGIAFKGSGFYKTDSRSSGSKKTSKSSDSTKSDSPKKDSGSSDTGSSGSSSKEKSA